MRTWEASCRSARLPPKLGRTVAVALEIGAGLAGRARRHNRGRQPGLSEKRNRAAVTSRLNSANPTQITRLYNSVPASSGTRRFLSNTVQ